MHHGDAPAQAETADAATLSTVQGTYESEGAEAWYGGYGTREFVFANGSWSLTFIHALDPGMTMCIFWPALANPKPPTMLMSKTPP